MKRRIALFVALMMVFCIALTGCGQDTGKNDANAEQVSINNLNNTYWIANSYKADDEHDSISVDGENNGIVLVFSNDRVSLIDCDGVQLKAAGYEYNNSKITFDGFNPETVYASIDGNELTLYSQNGSSWWLMTQTDIDTANAYIGQLLAGKDSFVIGEDFDTDDAPIIDGTDNPDEYSVTPESLDRTAWVRKGESDPSRRLAFFFMDGVVTIVSSDYYFDAYYRYKNYIMTTDPEEVGFDADVSGGEMEVTSFSAPYCTMTRVGIDEAIMYAKEICPDFASPFDGDYPGLDFDTGDSGIMDGSNDGTQNNNTTDNSNPKYENGQYVYVVGGKEIRLSINVWDYVKIGTKHKVFDWEAMLEHYGYTSINSTHGRYRKLEDGSRVEIGYRVWGDGEITGVYSDCSSTGLLSIRESNPDYSDGYIFSTGEKYPGNINSLILLAYAAEQRLANPTEDPFAEIYGEYAIPNGSPADYIIP